jgi:predicted MFS family arabinose efflux permease
MLIVLAVTTFFVLLEPPTAVRDEAVLGAAGHELRTLVRSRTLWAAGSFLALVYIAPGFTTPLLYLQTDALRFSPAFIGLMETIEGGAGLLGAALYGVTCRTFTLRQLLTSAIAVNALVTLLYLFYGRGSAPFIHAIAGFAVVASELALMDLAVRSTPPGCESLGFALMMSARNFAISGSDVLGSWLVDSHGWAFHQLVWLNAGTTALVLCFIPLLPRLIVSRRDGEPLPLPAASPAESRA